MTVYIEKPAVNLREELASLRNQGGYEEQQFYFDGLVTNGTFDTDTNWTKGTGWTISGGVATHASGSSGGLSQNLAASVAGTVYRVTLTASGVTAGSFNVSYGGATSTLFTTNGTHTFDLTAKYTGAAFTIFAASTFAGSIDNVSVFETDGTDVVHRVPKGWVPLHVYEDGLLQREGSAHDYEVVYDGFDYYVKLTVAPSATTQTCVIGVKA